MNQSERAAYAVFEGSRLIASGGLKQVAAKAKEALDRGGSEPLLVFDDVTGEVIDLDLRGTLEDVLARLPEPLQAAAPEAQRRPGRPKLGVVAREVTLLPRHWEWLNGQPGGASVALRKLVEQARRDSHFSDRVRQAQESTCRFLSAMAGNEPGFEESLRALFARRRKRFTELAGLWPADIASHAIRLAEPVFQEQAGGTNGCDKLTSEGDLAGGRCG
jgi:hypothetical protein